MRMTLVCAGIIIGLAAGRSAMAQEVASQLSLQEALSTARRDNPVLRSARKAIDAARGEKLQLEALSDPAIVWEIEGASNLKPAEFREQKIGLVQFLEFPGKQGTRGRIGEAQIAIERARSEILEAFVLTDVADSYFRLARHEAAIAILQESRELVRQLSEITRAKYQTNQVPYADIVRTQLEAARVDNELISLRREQNQEEIRLNLLLGRPSDTAFEVEELVYRPRLEAREDLLARRLADSRTLEVAELRQAQASEQVSLAKKSNLPDFGLGAFYQRVLEGGEEAQGFFAAEIGISVPLWRKRQSGEAVTAQAELDAAEIEAAALRERVRGDILRAYEEALTAAEQVAVFETTLLGEAMDGLEAGISAYQFGEIDSLELIDFYRTAKEVRLEYLAALEHYSGARQRLEYSGEILGF